jgi:hypothetical protein
VPSSVSAQRTQGQSPLSLPELHGENVRMMVVMIRGDLGNLTRGMQIAMRDAGQNLPFLIVALLIVSATLIWAGFGVNV